jgi:HSP20 family protein
MTLTRWSPLTNLAALEINSLNRMFEAAFDNDGVSRGVWVPAVDIFETANKDVVLKAELPDMKREDIKITFENGVLTLEGERKLDRTNSSETYHRVERSYGAFRRSFNVSASVDASNVQAVYRDGVLTVTLPRREETRPRQIAVTE